MSGEARKKLFTLKGKINAHLKTLSDKIEKVQEVKSLFYELTASMEWIYWTLDAIDLISGGATGAFLEGNEKAAVSEEGNNNKAISGSNGKASNINNNNLSASFGQMLEEEEVN